MKRSGYILFALLLFLITGCGTRSATVPATSNAVGTSPLSDDECITFAHELERHIEAGDADSATAMIDWKGLFDEAVSGLASEDEPNAVIEGLRVGTLRNPTATYAAIIEDTKAGGSYKFLRVKTCSDGKRVQFRFRGSNRGLNYHEILLARRNEKCVGRDIFLYTTGERHSQLIRRTAILASGRQRNNSSSLSEVEIDYQKHSAECAELTKAVNSGRYTDALAAYYQLPPSLQGEKHFLLSRIEAAEKVSKEETIAALEAFDKAYPDDTAVVLHLVQNLTLKGEYAAARKAIDHLDKSVGGDPFLDLLRAQYFLKEKNLDEAEAAAQKAIAGDRTLKEAWWVRVTVSLKRRDYSRAIELLKILETEHRQEPADITGPLYAEFVKSPEYRKWQGEKASGP